MKDEIRVNLAASLRSTTTDLSEVAHSLAGLSTDDDIEQQAKNLDRISEDASEAATILRALIVHHERQARATPPTGARQHFAASRVPHGPAEQHIASEDAEVTESLELLRREWDHAYVIWFQAGQYCACRRDNAAICRDAKAEDLRREISADYQAYPVLV